MRTGPFAGQLYRIYALVGKMIVAHHPEEIVRRYTLLAGIMASAFMFGTARAQGGDASASRAATDIDAPTALEASSPASRTSFGMWLGLSFDARTTSPNESIDRDLLVFGLRASRPFRVAGVTRLSYVFEVTPVMLLANPTRSTPPQPRCPPGEVCFLRGGNLPVTARRAFLRGRSTYGVGLAPLGLELEVGGPDHRLGGVLNLSGGGAYFTGPVQGNIRFDFTAAGGAALQWRTGGAHRLVAGYKLYHISNAGLGDINPGLNAHLFYLSFVRS